jgi:hypothetical protein
MSQTTIKNSNAIQFGSGKFEYSKDGSTWTDLGAMVNIVFTETFDKVTVMSDNAGVIKERIKNHHASLAGDLQEINLEDLSTLRGGLDKYTEDSGISETIKSGGLLTIDAVQVRVTNTNERNEIFRITIFKATNNRGITLNFSPDDADDPNVIGIELLGSCDTTLTKGEQLFEIYNEQGIGGINS